MRKSIRLIAGICFLASFTMAMPANAAKPGSVEMLLEHCKGFMDAKPGDPTDRDFYYKFGRCLGVFEAVNETMAYVSMRQAYAAGKGQTAKDILRSYGICLASGVDVRQQIAVFVKWARANPERWNELFIYGILAAWEGAWPCSK